jgi:hypothetical protein
VRTLSTRRNATVEGTHTPLRPATRDRRRHAYPSSTRATRPPKVASGFEPRNVWASTGTPIPSSCHTITVEVYAQPLAAAKHERRGSACPFALPKHRRRGVRLPSRRPVASCSRGTRTLRHSTTTPAERFANPVHASEPGAWRVVARSSRRQRPRRGRARARGRWNCPAFLEC